MDNWGTNEEIWRTIPPPLIPTEQDLELIRQACLPELTDASRTPRILVLGVTPALISAPWLAKREVHAVDFDQAMIDLFWRSGEQAHCHHAYWQEMPFSDDYFDLVVGDCSFNALPGLEAYDDVLREIDRVRRPAAPLVTRFFMQSEPRLAVTTLRRDATALLDGYSAAAKRLAIAIASCRDDGHLNLKDIPQRIVEQGEEVEEFLAALGQTPTEIVRAKKTYEIDQSLNYPNKAQLLEKLGPHFSTISFDFPGYDCGRFCPIVSCR